MRIQSSAEFKKSGSGAVAKAMASLPIVSGERSVEFVISTATVDSHNDTIDQSGWDFSDFDRNPVVLWAHDSDKPPIAKCISHDVIDGELHAVVVFPPEGICPHADKIFNLVKLGFINATSVGFIPTEWAYSDDRDHGIDFYKQTLKEFSIVAIPSNPDCLITDSDDDEMQEAEQEPETEEPTETDKSINRQEIERAKRKRLLDSLC